MDAFGLEAEQGPRPTYEVAVYIVYPTGYDDVPEAPGRERWRLQVVDAGDGWAIRRRRMCLNFRGEFEIDPPPDIRTPEFLHRCRFNERAALHRARLFIDTMTVDGLTFRRYIKQYREEMREQARTEVRAQAEQSAWRRLGRKLTVPGKRVAQPAAESPADKPVNG
jgi:hypothetical protein